MFKIFGGISFSLSLGTAARLVTVQRTVKATSLLTTTSSSAVCGVNDLSPFEPSYVSCIRFIVFDS